LLRALAFFTVGPGSRNVLHAVTDAFQPAGELDAMYASGTFTRVASLIVMVVSSCGG
jgi:hypothetical protein